MNKCMNVNYEWQASTTLLTSAWLALPTSVKMISELVNDSQMGLTTHNDKPMLTYPSWTANSY